MKLTWWHSEYLHLSGIVQTGRWGCNHGHTGTLPHGACGWLRAELNVISLGRNACTFTVQSVFGVQRYE